jgi:hypothetical protein
MLGAVQRYHGPDIVMVWLAGVGAIPGYFGPGVIVVWLAGWLRCHPGVQSDVVVAGLAGVSAGEQRDEDDEEMRWQMFCGKSSNPTTCRVGNTWTTPASTSVGSKYSWHLLVYLQRFHATMASNTSDTNSRLLKH